MPGPARVSAIDGPELSGPDVYLDGTDFSARFWEALATESPQPALRALLDAHPVLRAPGIVLFSRMRDVVAVNRHASVALAPPGRLMLGARRPLIPLQLDGALHQAYRRALDPQFSARRLALLEPWIRTLVDEWIEGQTDGDCVELFSSFCSPLPTLVFLRVLGLPADDLELLMSFKGAIAGSRGESVEEKSRLLRGPSDAMYEFIAKRVAAARSGRGAGLIAELARMQVESRRLADEELEDILYLLVVAGIDTTSGALSCLLAWLARHPRAQSGLREDLRRVPAAIEELLRWESPVPRSNRFALEDLEIHGVEIERGTQIGVLWACANLDEEVFPDAMRVHLARRGNRHVAFASGFHRCLGVHLARLELRVFVEQLLQRTSVFEIAPDEEPHYWPRGVRTARYLPVRVRR